MVLFAAGPGQEGSLIILGFNDFIEVQVLFSIKVVSSIFPQLYKSYLKLNTGGTPVAIYYQVENNRSTTAQL